MNLANAIGWLAAEPKRRPSKTPRKPRRVLLLAVLAIVLSTAFLAQAQVPQRPWLADLNAAQQDALSHKRPILVRFGSESCPWCRKLDEEIAKPPVQTELAQWTLVELDVDKSPDESQRLAVGPIPALRVLTPRGRLIASQDGYLDASKLVEWLQQHRELAAQAPDEVLLAGHEPSLVEVVRIVRQFSERDATVREAAIRRLLPFPKVAAGGVANALREGNLSARLTACEILNQWHAPLGALDPWRPETLTEQQFAVLDEWLTRIDALPVPGIPEKLTEEQLQSARHDLDQLVKVDPAEAAAVRERLARLGRSLLPEVLLRLRDASTDDQRERLLTLRYRLVANDGLVLAWPGGLERLADTDAEVRHLAAEDLAIMATAEQQPLLLALFGDPDPLVREISLRGLRHVGGEHATAALVELLNDPEPNVRAAVLKQLAEDKATEMVDKVAAYVKKEQDVDLIVHAIRYFRETKSPKAVNDLMPLLEHDSWQIRAEAAEALGSTLENARYGNAPENAPEIYDALLKRLTDPDAFVVSRALVGLKNVNAKHAVEPLVKAASSHPQLASDIVDILANGSVMREAAVPHLQEFFRQKNPAVRAAAIRGLSKTDPEHVKDVMIAAFRDEQSRVRTAAANSVLEMLGVGRPNPSAQGFGSIDPFGAHITVRTSAATVLMEEADPGIASLLLKSFFGVTKKVGGTLSEEKSAPPPTVEEPSSAQEKNANPPATTPDRPATPRTDAEPVEPPPTTVPPPTDAADNEPAGEPKPALDLWLTELYSGKHRAEWMSELVEPLEKMLGAAETEERLAAALALVPLNRAEQALPVVLASAPEKSSLFFQSTGVLNWLVWDRRVEMFWKLFDLAQNETERTSLLQAMNGIPDIRAGELYFRVLDRAEVTQSMGDAVQSGLHSSFMGNRYYDRTSITAAMKKRMAAAVAPHVAASSPRKRLAALDLLLFAAPDQALAAAKQTMDDPALEESLRRDAFIVALAAQTNSERVETAIEALAGTDAPRRTIALKFLAVGPSSLARLASAGFMLQVEDDGTFRSITSGQPIVPTPPRKLTADHVRPLLDHPDRETAAYAGYLLALFGEPEGLGPLLGYWRSQSPSDELDRLVYRAISAVDDSQHIAALKQIYGRLNQHEKGEFYWTIRGMNGPEILTFRKQIRDEVGVANLQ